LKNNLEVKIKLAKLFFLELIFKKPFSKESTRKNKKSSKITRPLIK
jgi:hypothetical protein